MRNFRCVILVCLFLTALIAGSAAAVDKGGGIQLIGSDPASTFTIGTLTNVFPLDTVDVPLYLDTPNDPTYTQNRLSWVEGDLVLLDVIVGDSIPSGATLTVEGQTSTEVQFNIWNGDNSLNVHAGVPIAYLKFEVQCFGYGVSTDVDFVGGDDLNWYDSPGNPPLAPLRVPGGVAIQDELYQWVDGGRIYALAGDQNMEWPVYFQQYTPGRLNDCILTYDHTILEVASIIPDPGMGGGDVVIVSNDGGVLELDLVGNPFMDPGETRIFTIYFNLLVPDDGLFTSQTIVSATRENVCGYVGPPTYLGGGWIRVTDHTAAADLGVTYPYYTADEYYLPVLMDSSYPINTFKLFVEFPNDDIEFVEVVGRSGYTAPGAWVDAQYPNRVVINNSSDTNYELSYLTTVFYLKFAPIGSYPSGTQFDLNFVQDHPETEIRYLMEMGGYRQAEITALTPGYIRLKSPPPPPPCCPALYTWNGREFVLENNVLAECDGKKVTEPVTEFYRVTGHVVQDADELRFQIREDADAVSTFENFELLVVDHPEDQPIQVTEDGLITSRGQAYRVNWARDHKGNDITDLISARDDVVYYSREAGWFDVSFGALNSKQIEASAVLEHDSQPKAKLCDDEDQLLTQGIDVNAGRKLKVSIKTAEGDWRVLSEYDARHHPKRQAAMIDPAMIDPGNELVLRYSWESYYRTDAVEFYSAAPYEGAIYAPRLWDAVHSETGTAASRLGNAGSARPLTLAAGEVIDLVFDAGDLPAVKRGEAREYVFVTTGKYDEPGTSEAATPSRGWVLDANVPNPFNPSTTISYSLAGRTRVELRVYDVTGALVRTLVSSEQPAGEKKVTWDGRSDSGARMASGVYFYRLETPEFTDTKKMLLLK